MIGYPSFSWLNSIQLHIYYRIFTQSSVDGHFACFQVLAIVNNAVTNVEMQLSLHDPVFTSFRGMPRSGISGSYDSSVPKCLKYLCTAFHSGWTRFCACQQCIMCESLSHVLLFTATKIEDHQAPLSMEFSRQEFCSGLPFPSPGNLPDPGMAPRSPALQADSLPSEPLGKCIGLPPSHKVCLKVAKWVHLKCSHHETRNAIQVTWWMC